VIRDLFPFNPFATVSVGDPWEAGEPDVPAIHQDTFQGITGLIGQIRITPNLCAVVFGDTGSGKTHLIKRLIRSQEPFSCVYVRPISDASHMRRRLLETVVTNLRRSRQDVENEGKGGESQVAVLLRKVIEVVTGQLGLRGRGLPLKKSANALADFLSHPVHADQVRQIKSHLKANGFETALERDFIDVFFQFPLPAMQDDVSNFLSGRPLDQNACGRLGLSQAEQTCADTADPHASEARSLDLLIAIGKIFRYGDPLILCFDQLETLANGKQFNSFGRLLADLVNYTPNVLPVCFCRLSFGDKLFKELDPHVRERLFANVFHLQSCGQVEALQLIRARLEWAFQGRRRPSQDPFHPLTPEQLEAVLQENHSPRKVLNAVNTILAGSMPEENPVDKVEIFFRGEREKLLNAPVLELCRPGIFLEILGQYAGLQPVLEGGFTVLKGSFSPEKRSVKLTVQGAGDEPLSLLICCEDRDHAPILEHTFDELTAQCASGQFALVAFLRDERRALERLPGMEKALAARERFIAAGGQSVTLLYHWLADFYALDRTATAVHVQDLTHSQAGGLIRAVEKEDYDTFARERFQPGLLIALAALIDPGQEERPRPPVIDRERLLKEIMNILRQPPFMFALDALTRIVAEANRGYQVPDDLVIEVIREADRKIRKINVAPPIYYLPKRS